MKIWWAISAVFFATQLWAQEPPPANPSPTPSTTPAGTVEHHLVSVARIYPPLLQEIRYATTYNFTGKVLYPYPAVFIHKDVAAALEKIQAELLLEGYGLKIYDGYRPLAVQGKMWELVPDERYVSDPGKSKGKHTRGTAVDVTLVDHMGNELKMPTGYDDFTEKAHRFSKNWNTLEKKNSDKLEAIMKKYGFEAFPYEWWHFDFQGWEKYPPLNISYEDLNRGVTTTVPVP